MANFLYQVVALLGSIVVQFCPGLAVEYCYSETFEPRCSTNQVIVMKRAVFGRMNDQGRCLQPDSLLEALKHDPRYLGCSRDVLPVMHRRCSGRTRCSIRIVDPELQQASPCYREMEKYMDASYTCVNVMQPDRTCEVSVSAERMFISPVTETSSANIICGSRQRPWLLEAPSGQRINISLLDFSGSSSSTSSVHHRARTVETTSSSGCVRQFGFIEDKSANRNINICTDDLHRQPTLYVSRSNTVAIVTESATGDENEMDEMKFLIGFIAVGCSDLVPPSDAWLKRSDNVATVGCYMTRQTWILTCDHTGRWTGTFGNCTQQLLEAYGHEDKSNMNVQRKKLESELFSGPVLVLAGITAFSVIICLVILCIGISWICRYREKQSRCYQSKEFNSDLLSQLHNDMTTTA